MKKTVRAACQIGKVRVQRQITVVVKYVWVVKLGWHERRGDNGMECRGLGVGWGCLDGCLGKIARMYAVVGIF